MKWAMPNFNTSFESELRPQPRVAGAVLEPLVVKPRDAWRMLGCGNTRGYELLAAGELDSFLDGRSRKITVASIHAYVARALSAATATGVAAQRSTSETTAKR
jgi:hypothetical protein